MLQSCIDAVSEMLKLYSLCGYFIILCKYLLLDLCGQAHTCQVSFDEAKQSSLCKIQLTHVQGIKGVSMPPTMTFVSIMPPRQ